MIASRESQLPNRVRLKDLMGDALQPTDIGYVLADKVTARMQEIGQDLSDRHLRTIARYAARCIKRHGDDVVRWQYETIRREALRMLAER